MKAYECTYYGTRCFVGAATPSKAKQIINLAVREVFEDWEAWTKIKVKRAPQFDAWAQTKDARTPTDPDYMPKAEVTK
jgi:hypothetical protein